jgi:hypothetical protein
LKKFKNKRIWPPFRHELPTFFSLNLISKRHYRQVWNLRPVLIRIGTAGKVIGVNFSN